MIETATALTMPELVEALGAGDVGRVALCVDGGRQLTFGEWLDRASRVADGLAVEPGDRLALLFDEADWIDYAVAALALYLSGATVVGLSPRLDADELRRRLAHCAVTGLLHGSAIGAPRFGGWSMGLDEAGRGAAGSRRPADCRPSDLAEIIYTSGTTGAPKPVAVTHANLTFGHQGGGRLPSAGHGVLAPVPLGTNAGHSAIMVALTGGSTVHLLSNLDPASVADALERLAIHLAILPAPLATRLVSTGLLDGRDLSRLGAVMLGSTPVPSATAHCLTTLLPNAATSIGYGSTESAPASVSLPLTGSDPAPGAVGHPRPGVGVEIRDGDGRPVGPGVVGHIWLRSPAPPRHYHGIDATRTFLDGWTRMGDLGSVGEDGCLHVFDRAADAIVVDGRLVSSFHIENALHWHPAVTDAAVVAVDGRPVAAVELREPVGTGELRSFLAGRLDQRDVPDRIVPMDSLPRGALGKVLKRRLRGELVP